MIAMVENWKDIPGYEGAYQVSDSGRVKSLEKYSERMTRWGTLTVVLLPERIMSPGRNKAGYLHVTLRLDKTDRTFLVHRLVALAFIQNPLFLRTVNHLDGVKSNNCVANLEWASQQANNHHARTALPYHRFRHAVVATREDGSRMWFESKKAAEIELCGRPTGLISWAFKNKRLALGMSWSHA